MAHKLYAYILKLKLFLRKLACKRLKMRVKVAVILLFDFIIKLLIRHYAGRKAAHGHRLVHKLTVCFSVPAPFFKRQLKSAHGYHTQAAYKRIRLKLERKYAVI